MILTPAAPVSSFLFQYLKLFCRLKVAASHTILIAKDLAFAERKIIVDQPSDLILACVFWYGAHTAASFPSRIVGYMMTRKKRPDLSRRWRRSGFQPDPSSMMGGIKKPCFQVN